MTEDIYPICLSARDAQKMTGMSRSMVYKLLNCSETGAFTIGKRRFFHRDKLLAWLERQSGVNNEGRRDCR